LFLGSSCIYPKNCVQPIKENMLLTGILEATNEPYAVAKISGIKLCESYNRQYGESKNIDYRSIMPSNLYGPGDNYHLKNSHVIPGLIRRFHEAKIKDEPKTVVWGSGNPRREFLYVDDLASASIHVMNLDKDVYKMSTDPMCSHINIGSGEDIKIKDLAEIIKNVVGYKGSIIYDKTKPDGVPQKLLDSSLINSLGWSSKVSLKKGIAKVYNNFKKNEFNS
jgi:GDP-L-fucose synthase